MTVNVTASGTPIAQAVIAPNGLDQTTQIQSALDGVDAGASVVLTAAANEPLVASSTLTISQPLTLRGESMSAVYGAAAPTAVKDAWALPIAAPFLRGSVINMATAATDAVHITVTGAAVNIQDLGIVFGTSGDATILQNTGHGIVIIPPADGANFQNGLMGANWSNVAVYGHDGNHYAYKFLNIEYCTLSQIAGFGGGGLYIDSNDRYSGQNGNSVFINPYMVTIMPGTADCYNLAATQGVQLNTWIRPQAWHYKPTAAIAGIALGSLAGPSNTQFAWRQFIGAGSGLGDTIVSPDFETTVGTTVRFSGTECVIGNPYFGSGISISNNVMNLPGGESVIVDTANTNAFKTRYLYGGLSNGSTNSGAATAAAGSAAGTSPPAPVTTGATTLRGTVTFGTGTTPAAGEQVIVTIPGDPFNQPHVVLSPNNAATAALGLYKSATTLTTFRVAAANAPSASQANTVYSFDYVVIG